MVRAVGVAAAVSSLALFAAPTAYARPAPLTHHRIATVNGTSQNWSGYNQGALETGSPSLFNQISGEWTVPTASGTNGQASSTWIGIGGGCLDTSCLATDATLIQTGTEQDIGPGGVASYSAWFELIPAPSITVSLPVAPGDHFQADIQEVVPNSNVWTITLTNTTANQTFSVTVPYSSTKGSAEWILETPLLIGTNAGFSSMPHLSTVNFDKAARNGVSANLQSSEEIDLVNGATVATPSAPDSDTDGFNACANATSCAAPTTS